MPKPLFLHVKLTGGATAQCLGLMNAIYASDKLKIPFKVTYYPYSTGTYWPFAIGELLENEEILDIDSPTKGLNPSTKFEVGKIIQSHPLINKKFSYEKILSIMRKINLEPGLQFLRRELSILASPKRLFSINDYYRSISGGFAAINEIEINQLMHERFLKSGKKSPFTKNITEKKLIVIHYRLGDKKAAGKHPEDFNSDLVIDPQSYLDVLDEMPNKHLENLYVVSDEPKLAQKLLRVVGINAKINSISGNIWDDLYFMSQSDVFIGSKSQVSQLANICVEHNGGLSYMFDIPQYSRHQRFENTRYIKAKFLDKYDEIYNLDFKLEENSHSAYINTKNNNQ